MKLNFENKCDFNLQNASRPQGFSSSQSANQKVSGSVPGFDSATCQSSIGDDTNPHNVPNVIIHLCLCVILKESKGHSKTHI